MTITKKTRYEVYALLALLIVLAFSFYAERSHEDVFAGVHADDGKFEPLNVPDPSLRMDLLARIQNEHYNGQHRNIFSEEPLPPPPEVIAQEKADEAQKAAAPPPLPPLTIPATFYGVVTDPATGQSRACFSNTDNVYILPVGGVLLHQFRVMKIGNNTVEVQDISSGRSTTLILPEAVSPQSAQQ